MAYMLTGLFPDRAGAERAISELTSTGFDAHLASIPDAEASYYQGRVEQGSILVALETQGRDAQAQQILLRAGALKLGPEGYQGQDATIGGIAPDAVTDASPQREQEIAGPTIGGIAPSAVTNAEPESQMADSRGGDARTPQTPIVPADSTIVSPGMEMPYTERKAQSGDTSEGHPITDDDIIAEAQRRRARDQSADLDVARSTDEANTASREQ